MTTTTVSEYRVNRDGWISGPWDAEPDRIDFEYKGLPCLILRNDLGNLCGYVAVPPSHPCFKTDYDNLDIEVHGGLTYCGTCNGHICHVPKPGEPDNVFWFGFDCAHSDDFVPGLYSRSLKFTTAIRGSYKDVAYVKQEIEHLADQLLRMEHEHAKGADKT